MGRHTLEAVLPITTRGERSTYVSAYVKGLLSSLSENWQDSAPLKIHVVHPGSETGDIEKLFGQFSGIECAFVAEDDLVPQFRHHPEMMGYFKQMIIKIAIARVVESDFYLTLDADIFCLKPIGYASLVRGGRAVTEWESRSAHPEWWHGSARLLKEEADITGQGLGVTPNILATALSRQTLDRVGQANGQDPLDFLASRGRFNLGIWTEYTLYTLGAGAEGLNRWHLPENDEYGAKLKLHSDTAAFWGRIDGDWLIEERVRHSRAGFFAIVQSSIGIDPSEIHKAFRAATSPADDR